MAGESQPKEPLANYWIVNSSLLALAFRVLFAFVREISWMVRLVLDTHDPRNHTKTTTSINTKEKNRSC